MPVRALSMSVVSPWAVHATARAPRRGCATVKTAHIKTNYSFVACLCAGGIKRHVQEMLADRIRRHVFPFFLVLS
jgi:hypothetical protein